MGRGHAARKTIHRAKDAFAWVEYEIDAFLISILKVTPSVRHKSIPLGMSRKLDMLFEFYCCLPRLREFGLGDGTLDLNRMNYWLSEIADHRNHMMHGHLSFTFFEHDEVEYTFRRFIREEGAIGKLGHWNWRTSRSYVQRQIRVAEMLALYFRDASRYLNEEIERDYLPALAKKQACQKEWWRETGQYLGLQEQKNFDVFAPFIKGEYA
ncbi:hypothetical protein A8B78_07535 [Jannaschia sp. EhC01]|nr:hypothetical protein A8B78_07535 [Jannaschia sp. EhC01]